MAADASGSGPTPSRGGASLGARGRAWSVHLMTASGVAFMFLAAAELVRDPIRPAWVFAWFAAATFVDAADGPFARRFRVKEVLPEIDGRTIDDIVDYLGFTFLPLMLVAAAGWVPGGLPWSGLWVVPGLIASLIGFAHAGAKDEAGGFFRGFPSYWNIAAFYLGLVAVTFPVAGPWVNGGILLVLAVLTVAPIRLLYPNLTPRPWRGPILIGGAAWGMLLLAMLPWYPLGIPGWVVLLSLAYPLFYTVLSLALWARSGWARRGDAAA